MEFTLYNPHHCHPLQPHQQPKKLSPALSVPPNDFSIHGNLLLPPNSLLGRSSPQAAEGIFGYDDDLLAQIADDRWWPSHDKTLINQPIAPIARYWMQHDTAVWSTSKQQESLLSPMPISQPSLPSNQSQSTPMIWQIEDICDHYLDSDAEDNNSEYKLNMFAIDKEINMATLDVND